MTTETRPALGYPHRLDGIDVSEFQEQIDYHRVAAAGFRFAIVRGSLGPHYVDRCAAKHLAGFRDAGMYAFVYGAAQPSKGDPRGQAKRLLDGMGAIYTRCALDLETRDPSTSSRFLIDFAEAFVDEIEAYGALLPALYTYPWFAKSLQPELSTSSLGRCPLWMASYGGAQPWLPHPTDAPYIPPPWDDWVLHQYSGDTGFHVPGVVGACDRDLFNGDEATFRRWLGLPDAPPTAPSPPPSGSS